MEIKNLQIFGNYCFDYFEEYFVDYNKILSKYFIDDIDSSWMEFILENKKSNKKILIGLSHSININNESIFIFRFFIENEKNSFSLKDYCSYRNMSYPISHDIVVNPTNNITQYFDSYFKELKLFIQNPEIAKIIFSDYWIDIPKDMSPYK